jgi:hypothetical protein
MHSRAYLSTQAVWHSNEGMAAACTVELRSSLEPCGSDPWWGLNSSAGVNGRGEAELGGKGGEGKLLTALSWH